MLQNEEIKKLQENGFKRWTKGQYDRLYIDALTVANQDEDFMAMVNRSGRFQAQVKATKSYVDVATGKPVIQYKFTGTSDQEEFKNIFEKMVYGILK